MEKRDTRLAIIEAAAEVFAQKGYEKATVDEIAAGANIAKGTVFYNFKSKEDIFFAIIEEGTQKFGELVKERSALGKTASEKLELAYDSAFEFFLKYNNFCTLLISEIWRVRTRWNYEPTHLLDRYKESMEEIFEEGQQSGEFRRDVEPKDIGLMVFFLAAVSSLSKALSGETDVEQKLFDRTRLILMKGIAAD
jgi:TetR/AcrR family transcriptional regulator